jgi:tetratricopeptide (TPR) repeat protein
VAIVSSLPPERSTSIPLATLGTLYRIKGDVLVYKRPHEVPDWYRKSLEALTRALPLDRAYSREQRGKALAQGWPASQIKAYGNGYLYQNLGDTYRRLGRFPEALEAFSHLMKLTPLNSAVYSQISEVDMALGKPDAAIVALWQAFALGKNAQSERALMMAYREAFPGGCAETSPGSMKPNLNCPFVKAQVCAAYEGLARVAKLEQYHQTAFHDYGCMLR